MTPAGLLPAKANILDTTWMKLVLPPSHCLLLLLCRARRAKAWASCSEIVTFLSFQGKKTHTITFKTLSVQMENKLASDMSRVEGFVVFKSPSPPSHRSQPSCKKSRLSKQQQPPQTPEAQNKLDFCQDN